MEGGIAEWIISNRIEISGTVFGIIYVILSVKQKVATWFFGLLTSLLYIYIFFSAKIYAQMSIQFYYVFISLYAWILWAKGSKEGSGLKQLHVTYLDKSQVLIFSGVTLLIWATVNIILKKFTDSPVSVADSLIAALSITATWMLARKKIENWLIWIVANGFSVGLYLYQNMYATSILYIIYLASAVWGFIEWRRDYKKING
ncbi:MAG: nicotinamide mononucleotide transporter [Prolixibacteraceae bacterium]|nr:nicotinamide mononucleotide transporter [Prolixibacteraceae bacterium]